MDKQKKAAKLGRGLSALIPSPQMPTGEKVMWKDVYNAALSKLTQYGAAKPVILTAQEAGLIAGLLKHLKVIAGETVPDCARCRDSTIVQVGPGGYGRCPDCRDNKAEQEEVAEEAEEMQQQTLPLFKTVAQ